MKTCWTCKEVKPLDQFGKDKSKADGLCGNCRMCRNAQARQWRKSAGATNEAKAARAIFRASLPSCQKARRSAQKRQAYASNPEKYREASRRYRSQNPEKAAASIKASRQKRADYYAEYHAALYESQREQRLLAAKAYFQSIKGKPNPGGAARTMKRYAAKLQAIPPWADLDAIKALYKLASDLTASTGVPHHVDHIVPLQSKYVCGLHVEANLQVLPSSINQRKSNRIWPDCPDHLLRRVPAEVVALVMPAPPSCSRQTPPAVAVRS